MHMHMHREITHLHAPVLHTPQVFTQRPARSWSLARPKQPAKTSSAYECRPPPFAPVAAGAARPRPLVDSDRVPARRFGGGDGVLIARPVVELEAQRRLAERLACPSPRPPSRVGTRLQSARSAPATVDTPRGSARSARPRETPNSARRCTSQKA